MYRYILLQSVVDLDVYSNSILIKCNSLYICIVST